MRKVVLVTGSSRGIGAATAMRLAADGYDVCINYFKDGEAAAAVVANVKGVGANAIAVKADVAKEKDVIELFRQIDCQLGPLTSLVNNAGILLKQTRIEDMTAERINRIITTNITSYFLCSREAIKRMSCKHGGGGGVIVNVSSAASRLGSGGEYVDYAASKGAIDTMTRGMAVELADDGIRVNCVRPGFIHTDMHKDGGEPDRIERLKSQLPLRRGGSVDEVAAAIAWLLSDESSYSTGSFIDVSGGR